MAKPTKDCKEHVQVIILGEQDCKLRQPLLQEELFLFLQPEGSKIVSAPQCQHDWSGLELLQDAAQQGRIFFHGILVMQCAKFKGFGINYTGESG